MAVEAKVICDSVSPNGERLTTVEVNFHRFILSQLNTHRIFSRNYQSSRAVPVEKIIEQVENDPAMPIHWGKNQRGMVADEEQNNKVLEYSDDDYIFLTTKEEAWKNAMYYAVAQAEEFHNAGYHKQIVNRLLEPFMWTKGIITATQEGWDSFFKLRLEYDAQPEIQLLAQKIKEAMDESTPRELNYGDWHLPYIGIPYNDEGFGKVKENLTDIVGGLMVIQEKLPEEDVLNALEGLIKDNILKYSTEDLLKMNDISLEEAIKVSISCCAQVSYRALDTSLEKANKIYDMLNLPEDGVYKEGNPHFSPAEHIACCGGFEGAEKLDPLQKTMWLYTYTGNFSGDDFIQYRKAMEYGYEKSLIDISKLCY